MYSPSPSETLTFNRKAVALLSGGLDSALAIYLVKRQGIEVTALHFTSFFSPEDSEKDDSPVTMIARQLGVPLVSRPKGEDFLELIRNPRYGHGKNLNPCIDCRIYTLVKAREVMAEIGASFIVTGEVLGQRPMSQRRNTMRLIEKQAGCDGIVVRPLSAKRLEPSLPEKQGIVNRHELLDVAGRGRKAQLALAEEIGLVGYSPPAGGCLLTDKGFSNRVRDLLSHCEDVQPEDLKLLGIGRHLRVRPGLKLIVGRREEENGQLLKLATRGILFIPRDFPGPTVLAQGLPDENEIVVIGKIIRRYARESTRGNWIRVVTPSEPDRLMEVTGIIDDEWIQSRII
jgi:hypothetical protein